ncbi:hypothetical protein LINGRAHAP2_LOCUS3245, partial [Linum grandiflorum]
KQTKYGDWYDCVDFYKQPAFDHPLLKDHKYKYQMSPSSDQLSDIGIKPSDIKPSDIWKNEKGCPTNTVPIKRVTKEDLIRLNKVSLLNYHPYQRPGTTVSYFVAVLQTTNQEKYYGGGMKTSIYHPAVQENQYSSSRIKIVNEPDSIAVGWVVNPSLYPDNQTHMFIYTMTKDMQCYNTYCPGFVITTSWSPPDQLLNKYPEVGKTVWEIPLLVFKDPASGDWFLNVGKDNFTVGYWPQKIFTALVDSANYVEWGGEVFSPPGTTPPPMGSGKLPGNDRLYDCFGYGVKTVIANQEVDLDPEGCQQYQNSLSYQISDIGVDGHRGRSIYFGGADGL